MVFVITDKKFISDKKGYFHSLYVLHGLQVFQNSTRLSRNTWWFSDGNVRRYSLATWCHAIASMLEFSLPWSSGLCVTASCCRRAIYSNKVCNGHTAGSQSSLPDAPSHNTILMMGVLSFQKKALVLTKNHQVAVYMSVERKICQSVKYNHLNLNEIPDDAWCGLESVTGNVSRSLKELRFHCYKIQVINQHKQQRAESCTIALNPLSKRAWNAGQ